MKIIVDGKEIDAVLGEPLLRAAKRAGINIPTLCHHESLEGQGRCRLCMVEVSEGGRKELAASCTYPVKAGIEVATSTPLIDKIRRNIIMLLYKRAAGSPLMQQLFQEYGCHPNSLKENTEEKCILCNICVQACAEIGSSAISLILRGTQKRVATPYDEAAAVCIGCGTCARVCPTGAIEMTEKDGIRIIWNKAFAMQACSRCGRYYASHEEIVHLAQRNLEYMIQPDLCEDCRKRIMAQKITAFVSE